MIDFKENFISTQENGNFVSLCAAGGEFFHLILRRIPLPGKEMEISYFCVLQKEYFFS